MSAAPFRRPRLATNAGSCFRYAKRSQQFRKNRAPETRFVRAFRSDATPESLKFFLAVVRQALLDGWVSDRSVAQRSNARSELRRNDLAVPHDVQHEEPFRQQVISDNSAVTAPPHGFGTHDDTTLVASESCQFL